MMDALIRNIHERPGYFQNEKQYEEVLWDNQELVLDLLQLKAPQEWYRNSTLGQDSNLRPDWRLQYPDKNVIIEIKHCSSRHPSHAIRQQAIGLAQLMMYATKMPDAELFLIDLAICPETQQAVDMFRLPINLAKVALDHGVVLWRAQR